LGFAVGGALLLGVVAFLIAGYLFLAMQAVVESRWAFTEVRAERICATGHHHDCLVRTPGLATNVIGFKFDVSLDVAPYAIYVKSLGGPPPSAGSQVVVEEWNGRLVSVVDAEHGRRHAEEWPRRWHDLSEAGAALVVVIGVPALIAWGWIVGRRELRAGAVTEQPAQTS
jgi:hypothetical protein